MWRRIAATVTPLEPRMIVARPAIEAAAPTSPAAPEAKANRVPASRMPAAPARRAAAPRTADDKLGLDSSWERKIARGGLDPDFSLDLHGSGLDQAYVRLMHGMAQARAMGARVVLVVTGKPRPTEAADRGTARGAIRAKIIDWLGASEHAGSIAAIRGAHKRHGGQGALYVVLKKRR
jgi:DNA-nicking Smr family endonuclease